MPHIKFIHGSSTHSLMAILFYFKKFVSFVFQLFLFVCVYSCMWFICVMYVYMCVQLYVLEEDVGCPVLSLSALFL